MTTNWNLKIYIHCSHGFKEENACFYTLSVHYVSTMYSLSFRELFVKGGVPSVVVARKDEKERERENVRKLFQQNVLEEPFIWQIGILCMKKTRPLW